MRQGAVGGAGSSVFNAQPGLGGRPAVDGVTQPAPPAAGIGGNGGPHPPPDNYSGLPGGPGYVIIWW